MNIPAGIPITKYAPNIENWTKAERDLVMCSTFWKCRFKTSPRVIDTPHIKNSEVTNISTTRYLRSVKLGVVLIIKIYWVSIGDGKLIEIFELCISKTIYFFSRTLLITFRAHHNRNPPYVYKRWSIFNGDHNVPWQLKDSKKCLSSWGTKDLLRPAHRKLL